MPFSSPQQLAASMAADISWANTIDRSGRTAPARSAFEQRFLDQASGDPTRAEHFRRAYFKGLALKSVQARRRASESIREAEAAEDAIDELVGGAS